MACLEVETKLRIPDSELERIKSKVKKIALFKSKEKKVDCYYAISKSSKASYPKKAFRIRQSKGQYEINFKKWLKKYWTSDIVVKREFEFVFKKSEELKDFLALLEDLGFSEWIKKVKYNETYKYKKDQRVSIEINKVVNLGWFMEIEYLCKLNEIENARRRIREVLEVLEIPKSWIDNTGYTKMLWKKSYKVKY